MLYIDGDACPDIPYMEQLAHAYEIPMVVYTDSDHIMTLDYAMVRIVDTGFQSVDMHLMNEMKANDIVVTQDYGVAVVALSKHAFALHPKGMEYTDENMDLLLNDRHISLKLRKAGKKGRGPKKRTKEDTMYLLDQLTRLITLSKNMK